MLRSVTIWFAYGALVTTARAAVWHVDDDNCPGPGSGSPGDPFCAIQNAIDAADAAGGSGHEIIVYPGEYREWINFLGVAVTLRSSDGPEVTIIDGGGTGPVVRCQNGEGSDTVLEGFTITGGLALDGGGMYINGASPKVANCIFEENVASMGLTGHGGGIYVYGGSPLVTGCTFLGNTVGGQSFLEAYGGGMYLEESNATVINCRFLGNSAAVEFPAPTVTAWGGGMYVGGGNPLVVNCTFSGNSVSAAVDALPGYVAQAFGGAIANDGGNLTVTNCTLTGNSAGAAPMPQWAFGAGVCSPFGGAVAVANCIFVDNTTGTPDPDVYGSVSVTYSCSLPFPISGTGNIVADPLLVDGHLYTGSPCIDAGDNSAIPPEALDLDADGHPRRMDDPDTADSGAGTPPIVDMGAYEYWPDCNRNGIPDAVDISGGASEDCNTNGIPDDCEIGGDKVTLFDLTFDPGWSTEGLWAFGQPTGGGGQDDGYPDPTSGYTGKNVYGYNLNGDYENDLPERHLTTAAIDCSDLQNVRLRFRRWLNVEQGQYDHAYVRVSNDGDSWTTVFSNPRFLGIRDSYWRQYQYTISSVADGQPTVYVRWTMGTTDWNWRFSGWNIDDVEIIGKATGDCNQNEIPDDCDISCGTSEDCNTNGVPDECETDCNGNDIPDECDIADGTSADCNMNDVPDECETDCNENDIPDECDIAGGASEDIDADGIPDECEPVHNVTRGTIHPTLQEGIDLAVGGDEIEVGPGTYVERITLLGKAITLRSTEGPEVTIIDGDAAGSVITCSSGEGPDTVIEGFTVTNGAGQNYGGGMRNTNSGPTVVNCMFNGNAAGNYGGGMHNSTSSPTLINCTFSGNTAGNDGGGMVNIDSSPTLANCTFSRNSANDEGGGMAVHGNSSPILTNCIFWGNSAPDEPQIFVDSTSTTTATYCCIEGGWPGAGNVDADPLFVDADGPDNVFGTADDDVRLRPGSPCIDAGDNTAVPADTGDLDGDGDTTEPTPFDVVSHARFVNDLATDDTGNPSAEFPDRIVDMGAYEAATAGDCNWDEYVDLADHEVFCACLSGPHDGLGPACWMLDLNGDGDVDLDDFASFQQHFAGSQ